MRRMLLFFQIRVSLLSNGQRLPCRSLIRPLDFLESFVSASLRMFRQAPMKCEFLGDTDSRTRGFLS